LHAKQTSVFIHAALSKLVVVVFEGSTSG